MQERNRLAIAHQGLVRKAAHEWVGKCREPLDDLIQEGAIGLIRALDRYDPSKGAFSSFATRSIDSQIRHYLRDKGWGCVKPPRQWIETVSKVRTYQRSSQKQGQVTTETEAAIACGVQPADYAVMVASRRPVEAMPEGLEFAAAQSDEELEMINQAVDRLSHPIHTCIVERFYHHQSLRTLAKQHGVKQAQIKLWLQMGLEQMKQELEAI